MTCLAIVAAYLAIGGLLSFYARPLHADDHVVCVLAWPVIAISVVLNSRN